MNADGFPPKFVRNPPSSSSNTSPGERGGSQAPICRDTRVFLRYQNAIYRDTRVFLCQQNEIYRDAKNGFMHPTCIQHHEMNADGFPPKFFRNLPSSSSNASPGERGGSQAQICTDPAVF